MSSVIYPRLIYLQFLVSNYSVDSILSILFFESSYCVLSYQVPRTRNSSMLKLQSTLCTDEFEYIAKYTDPEIYLGGDPRDNISFLFFFLFFTYFEIHLAKFCTFNLKKLLKGLLTMLLVIYQSVTFLLIQFPFLAWLIK